MENNGYKLEEVISFIKRATYLIDHSKAKEHVIRDNFTSYLARIYPEPPSWVNQHIVGGESVARFARSGKERRGFIDNLVGLTVIEYERDLRISEKFNEGYNQIKQFCASKINEGHPVDRIIGILSDTIRWYAYRVSKISKRSGTGILGSEDIELEKIDEFSAVPTEDSARGLINFWQTYLGRIGARPLNAYSIAEDFGFESIFSHSYIDKIGKIVNRAINENKEYAKIISKLWNRVVTERNLSDEEFDVCTYRDELYMLTLGKLICANIIERKALISSKEELIDILRGDYFVRKGFTNLVEYDYFGWINNTPYLEQLLLVARDIQENLRVYDFENMIPEDLFGRMFAQLSNRTERILLGQEWTPHWLANKMVEKLFNELPINELPQFVDMCCGSGVMIVETLKAAKKRIEEQYPTASIDEKIRLLLNSITGFDIDPLAVILSKISWIIAAQDWLTRAEGIKITIPIYHADSLFAVTPLNKIMSDTEDIYKLELGDSSINLPQFMLAPEYRLFFDSIIDTGYEIALGAKQLEATMLKKLCDELVSQKIKELSLSLTDEQFEQVKDFISSFIEIVNRLHLEGKNGLWAYIIKNSYRPGLVAGQFNGLISNPPWLTLSKIGNNPYKEILNNKAKEFNINPTDSAFLHIELSTIFLLHGVQKYLKDGAVVACIVPDSVMNGKHHNPFRLEKYKETLRPVHFNLTEIWKVEKHTFKNEAIVLIGNKRNKTKKVFEQGFEKIKGKIVNSEGNDIELSFYKNVLGDRTAWNEKKVVRREEASMIIGFQQGADIMPRTFYCYDVTPVRANILKVKSIDLDSSMSFVITDAKNYKDFRIDECYIQNDVIFNIYISKLLTPFELSSPIQAVLPIRIGEENKYELIPFEEVLIRNDDLKYIIGKISEAIRDYHLIWEKLNTRNKLVRQSLLPRIGYFVFVGTSGGKVCAAYKSAEEISIQKVIIDQTLNWAYVVSEEEALYLTGLFNSDSINEAINVFQPRGQQGARHIHSLPYEVTPPFDPSNQVHREVVENTRKLIEQYNQLKNNEPDFVQKIIPQNGTLAQRRIYAKNKIKNLPIYNDYEKACRRVYNS